MGKKLYVGNLTYEVTDSTLEKMFAAHGTVQSAQVIMDRDTGRSKGFGFVEMGSDQEAQTAIQALNGKEVEGRSLTVNEARPKEGGGGGGGGGGGRGDGGAGGPPGGTCAPRPGRRLGHRPRREPCMRKLRIGVIDLVSRGPTRAWFARVMNANLASIMPQVVATWGRAEGHDVAFVCYTGFE